MDIKLEKFIKLVNLFSSNGFKLYLVGGTVRDILLNVPLDDMDVVTDATPIQMKSFIDGDYTFSKFGSVKCKVDGVKFDITTLRKEKRYRDYRHPLDVIFVKELKQDYKRRDFTINAMYMDQSFQLIDFDHGLDDINNRVIRMVGNPKKRIKEDPLRILRAIRFALTYDFTIEPRLEKTMIKSKDLLNNISTEKIKQELLKIKNVDKDILIQYFDKYSIKHILNVLE